MVEAASAPADANRGRPYYDKLRADLKASIDKKRELDRTLSALEESIARSESIYLEETVAAGNIIKGFDNYIKASSGGAAATTGGGTSTRRKGGITDADRIFSRSSISWTLKDAANNAGTPADTTPATGSARDTPVERAGGRAAVLKKKKGGASGAAAAGTTDDDSERPAKRSKVTWGRD